MKKYTLGCRIFLGFFATIIKREKKERKKREKREKKERQ